MFEIGLTVGMEKEASNYNAIKKQLERLPGLGASSEAKRNAVLGGAAGMVYGAMTGDEGRRIESGLKSGLMGAGIGAGAGGLAGLGAGSFVKKQTMKALDNTTLMSERLIENEIKGILRLAENPSLSGPAVLGGLAGLTGSYFSD